MYKELLSSRNLPPLLPRQEMLDILQKEIYGYMPPKPEKLTFSVQEKTVHNFCAGKAVCNKVTANCTVRGKEFSFPFYASLPTDGKKHPFFVHINFRDNIPDLYQPTEELIDNGFAVLSFCYKDVTADNGDLTDGLAGVLFENGIRGSKDPGKLAMWAWAAHRVLDYAVTLEQLTFGIVCGHSRLGKTALLAAATDARFAFAYSNDSGCSGAAITRGKQGEALENICTRFPYWFCENYQKYMGHEDKMPFDQHYLLAAIPGKVMVGSAQEDLWADPVSEFLCCVAAGMVSPDRLPEPGDAFLSGKIGYHLRTGTHFFSRTDWLRLIEFIKQHEG